ncbi:MAG: class I SAM-dependent methyltransferase [Candidatus Diapherotrites archaeon]|uniref:Class I SAM-dependent methyltransferase n=1 Tax=Candidatus Iainarchaeum sp. TaxID=3101447 RepID=A0A8T4L8R5_9ARCH|nr:class I SAM-dependent methyltransferase [Candidatus Diapherotrites archaeon]
MTDRKKKMARLSEKYSLGILDQDNSLSQYNGFLKNMGEPLTIEDFVSERFLEPVPVRVLEIGCGKARALFELKEKFGKKVETIGIDLVVPKKNHSDVFLEGDAWRIPFPRECNVIFSFRALHEVGFSKDMVQKITEALGIGGVGLLSFRIAESIGGKKSFLGEMTEADEVFLVDLPLVVNGCSIVKTIFFDKADPKIVSGIFLKIEK